MRLASTMVFAALLIMEPGAATAANAQIRDEDECLRLHPGIVSPVEMAPCTFDLEGSRQRLTTAYARLRRLVASDDLPLLERGQESWLSYRDAECRYRGGANQNTMSSSYVVACTADMNRARAADLEADMERWSR